MANRTVLLCLLILCTSIYLTECKRWGGGGSRSSGRSSGGSSWGKSWGGGGSSKPSSGSSGSSWFSSGTSYKPSSSWNTGSSSSGTSLWNSGRSGSSYPSSTGLSGSGSGSHSYPSSGGLSGSSYGSSKPSYPSGTGLSGSGSGSHSYPSSGGLSGSSYGSSKPSYPSGTGLSGLSSGNRYNTGSGYGTGSQSYPSGTGLSGSGSRTSYGTGSGSHSYPSGSGLSGSGSGNRSPSYGSGSTHYYPTQKPTYTYNTNTGYGSNSYHPGSNSYHPGSSNYHGSYSYPTIYHYPQHVYVTQYRDSGSRYGDLLTGLALYNMGRSHSHYHTDHYYYDDYYRTRYYGSGSSYRPQEQRAHDEAVCTLRVVENGKVQLLKIPCEIVSTFTEGSKKVNNPSETRLNQTVCTTNTTVTRHTNTTSSPSVQNNSTQASITNVTAPVNIANVSASAQNVSSVHDRNLLVQEMIDNITKTAKELLGDTFDPGFYSTLSPIVKQVTSSVNASNVPATTKKEIVEGNKTTTIVTSVNSTETIVNTTVCTTSTFTTDPLSAKGPPINPSGMECSVDIKTKDAYFRNKVDCNVLVQYSKKPISSPKQESSVMPGREKLKSWLEKPPWWMSMFIAV